MKREYFILKIAKQLNVKYYILDMFRKKVLSIFEFKGVATAVALEASFGKDLIPKIYLYSCFHTENM